MPSTVPQFIERQSKIFGPLTFTQFIYIGIGGVICLFFYFSIAKTHLLLFLVIMFAILGSAGSLAFLKISGLPLPSVLQHFFFFFMTPKMYLWRRKNVLPKMIKTYQNLEKKDESKTSPLKFSEKSQLRNLLKTIETKK